MPKGDGCRVCHNAPIILSPEPPATNALQCNEMQCDATTGMQCTATTSMQCNAMKPLHCSWQVLKNTLICAFLQGLHYRVCIYLMCITRFASPCVHYLVCVLCLHYFVCQGRIDAAFRHCFPDYQCKAIHKIQDTLD